MLPVLHDNQNLKYQFYFSTEGGLNERESAIHQGYKFS